MHDLGNYFETSACDSTRSSLWNFLIRSPPPKLLLSLSNMRTVTQTWICQFANPPNQHLYYINMFCLLYAHIAISDLPATRVSPWPYSHHSMSAVIAQYLHTSMSCRREQQGRRLLPSATKSDPEKVCGNGGSRTVCSEMVSCQLAFPN